MWAAPCVQSVSDMSHSHDLLHTSRRRRVFGVLALLTAALWSSYLLEQYRAGQERLAIGRYEQADLISRQQVTLQRVHITSNHSDRQQLEAELNYPWPRIIEAIETPTGPKVQLLSIDPDRGRAQLTVRGEAEELADVMDYLERLAKQPLLSDTRLERHSLDSDSGRVAFVASANWRMP